MHIVFLTHEFPNEGKRTGGAATYVHNMARIMAINGHTVDVIVEDEKEEILVNNGITIHRIRATRGFKNTGKPMPTYKKLMKNICRSYWYNKEVAKINKVNNVDMVQSVNCYALSLFRKKNIPYIVRLSSYTPLWSRANKEYFDFNKSIASRRIDEMIQLIALKRADGLISPSALMQKVVYGIMGVKPYVVESPITIDDDSKYILDEGNITENNYFLTYGSLNLRKSIHILAQIIDILLDKYPNMKYVIIGGDRESYYKGKYIYASELFYSNIVRNRDRFVFLGGISDRDRLFSIVKHASICVLPTRVDNLPNTCLESMALGKIIVSTTSKEGTSVEQLITDGENGFLAEVDNPESLLIKIEYAMNLSSEEKEKIQAKAKERVKDLTPELVYPKMMDIYEKYTYKHKK